MPVVDQSSPVTDVQQAVPVAQIDWRLIATAAGEHGVRHRTNTALLAFLAAVVPGLPCKSGEGADHLRDVSKLVPTDAQVREAMQTAWDDFCDDAQAYPGDMRREGRKLFFTAGVWADHTAMHLRHALATFAAANDEGVARAIEAAAKVAENLCADMTVEANEGADGLTSTLHRASAQTAGKIAAAIRLLSQGGGK